MQFRIAETTEIVTVNAEYMALLGGLYKNRGQALLYNRTPVDNCIRQHNGLGGFFIGFFFNIMDFSSFLHVQTGILLPLRPSLISNFNIILCSLFI